MRPFLSLPLRGVDVCSPYPEPWTISPGFVQNGKDYSVVSLPLLVWTEEKVGPAHVNDVQLNGENTKKNRDKKMHNAWTCPPLIAQQRRCGCGDESGCDCDGGDGGGGVCRCCLHRCLLGRGCRLLLRTRSGGCPRRLFGTPWNSTLCDGSGGTLRTALCTLPTCRTASKHTVECHRESRLSGRGCA